MDIFLDVDEDMVIVIIHPIYISWCFTAWTSTIYAETVGYASHSLATISLPLSELHAMYNWCLVNNVTNPNSNEYKFTAIVLDIAGHRLFNPLGIKKVEIDKRSFLKLSFANKGLDGINLGNILHHSTVNLKIPPYFKNESVPIILYVYTRPIVSKMFNYKHVLQNLNIYDFKFKPPDCTCASSPFIYNPTGHVIIGDLKIINNTSLREVFAKGPESIDWKHKSQL